MGALYMILARQTIFELASCTDIPVSVQEYGLISIFSEEQKNGGEAKFTYRRR